MKIYKVVVRDALRGRGKREEETMSNEELIKRVKKAGKRKDVACNIEHGIFELDFDNLEEVKVQLIIVTSEYMELAYYLNQMQDVFAKFTRTKKVYGRTKNTYNIYCDRYREADYGLRSANTDFLSLYSLFRNDVLYLWVKILRLENRDIVKGIFGGDLKIAHNNPELALLEILNEAGNLDYNNDIGENFITFYKLLIDSEFID